MVALVAVGSAGWLLPSNAMAAAQEACPNADTRKGFSVILPDCRAYEQVTPPTKNYGHGGPGGSRPVATAAIDAPSVAYNTGGPLPEATTAPFFNVQIGTRNADGWSSRTFGPVPALVPGVTPPYPVFLSFSPDLSKAILIHENPPLTAEAVENKPSLYLQDVNARTWKLLSPAGNVNTEGLLGYGGAADDYSRVYYSSPTPQVPGAPPQVFGNSQVYGVSGADVFMAGILPNGEVSQTAILPRPVWESANNPPHVTHQVSSDGSRVFFTDTGFTPQLYLRVNADQPQAPSDPSGHCAGIELACTVEVSASQKTNGTGTGGRDPNGPQPAIFQGASADSELVIFTSPSELTNDANTGRNASDESIDFGRDLYMYNLGTGQLSDLTVATDPADKEVGANVLGIAGAADDLSYIYFVATGSLAPGAVSGEPNLYVWHAGVTKLIGTLSPEDRGTWARRFDETESATEWTARVTPDGESFAFDSRKPLTGYDNRQVVTDEPTSQVYLYNAPADTLVCASCNPSGARPLGPSTLDGVPSTFNVPRNLTPDASRLFFNSDDALVLRDVNSVTDVYQYHAGGLSLISTGTTGAPAMFDDASRNGSDVYFATRAALVGTDLDTLVDLYDARIGGGFPETLAPGSCIAEACRPQAVPPPSLTPPGSTTLRGPGNRRVKRKKACHRHKKQSGKRHHKRCHRKAGKHRKAQGGK